MTPCSVGGGGYDGVIEALAGPERLGQGLDHLQDFCPVPDRISKQLKMETPQCG
jgi:hypothetical protein